MDFKKKSRPFFIIIFKLKNGNFKTRDFSPLIERVLAGVFNYVLGVDQRCTYKELPQKKELYIQSNLYLGGQGKHH